MLGMRGRPSGWDSTIQSDEGLRQVILKFIADFADWDNAAKQEHLVTTRGLVQVSILKRHPWWSTRSREAGPFHWRPYAWVVRYSPATSTR